MIACSSVTDCEGKYRYSIKKCGRSWHILKENYIIVHSTFFLAYKNLSFGLI